ncbi:Autophagy protein Apg5 containing protein [Aphelenchoides avenae]|nr:Autophagy protein Apg5 containing protein [Aphelenchus avenae]
MADDYEITRTVWDAKVPVEFCLDTSEYVLRTAQSFYAMLPRVTYFPLCMHKVLQFFATTVDEIEDVKDAWLQCNDSPVKWHYPVGVLYDLFVPEQSTPWVITVKMKDFPDELVRGTKEGMRNCFIQSVKEADYLKHKGNVMSTMHSDEHARLFDSVVHERFDEFWSVNKKLMSHADGGFLNIPMRFYEVAPCKHWDALPTEPRFSNKR